MQNYARRSKNMTLSYYPLSLVVLSLWAVYIVAVFSVLEYTVRNPEQAYNYNLQIWPKLLLTWFAQGHLFITGMHLNRLGISALQDARFAPRTWLELFWFTGKEWISHIGWARTTLWDAFRKRARLSGTFLLFIITVILAVIAPSFLERAYPAAVVEAVDRQNYRVLSLAGDDTNRVDPLTQVNIGQSGWTSGLEVEQSYEGRVFFPYTAGQPTLGDVVFSAETNYTEAVAPSIRFQGACQALDGGSTSLGLSEFEDICTDRGLNISWTSTWYGLNITADMASCSNLNATTVEDATVQYWALARPNRTEHALVWLNLTDYTTNTTYGVIECTSHLSTGTAHLWTNTVQYLDGISEQWLWFDQYTPKELFNDTPSFESDSVGPFLPPLFTALQLLVLPIVEYKNDSDSQLSNAEQFISGARMLGFTPSSKWDDELGQFWQKPSLDGVANALWNGAVHLAAAVNVAASQNQPMELIERYDVPGLRRSKVYFGLAIAVIATWLIILLILTMLLFRPSFSSGMDSYTVVRIAAKRSDLFEGNLYEGLDDNPKLTEPFRVPSMSTMDNMSASKSENAGEHSTRFLVADQA
jgi:hypothetical protein